MFFFFNDTATTEIYTLSLHDALPIYIANGFFRAGFIETWGRGIEKICESCKNYGIKLPEYTVYPEDIMVKFEALNTAKNTANKIDENIQFVLDYLKEYPSAKIGRASCRERV